MNPQQRRSSAPNSSNRVTNLSMSFVLLPFCPRPQPCTAPTSLTTPVVLLSCSLPIHVLIRCGVFLALFLPFPVVGSRHMQPPAKNPDSSSRHNLWSKTVHVISDPHMIHQGCPNCFCSLLLHSSVCKFITTRLSSCLTALHSLRNIW